MCECLDRFAVGSRPLTASDALPERCLRKATTLMRSSITTRYQRRRNASLEELGFSPVIINGLLRERTGNCPAETCTAYNGRRRDLNQLPDEIQIWRRGRTAARSTVQNSLYRRPGTGHSQFFR